MVGRLVAAMAIAALSVPATARAAPEVVLRAQGASLAVRDAAAAAKLAQRAPVTIDRFGDLTWDAFCVRLAVPGDPGECEGQIPPTLDDPVALVESGPMPAA